MKSSCQKWAVVLAISILGLVLLRHGASATLGALFNEHPIFAATLLAAACIGLPFLIRTTATSDEFRDAGLISAHVIFLVGLGIILTGAAAILSTDEVRGAAQRAAMLWALGWLMLGFLVGFLFGVPKVDGPGVLPGSPAAQNPTRLFVQRPNTNLEQISDWLTKIIVGLTLVHLGQASVYLQKAARWVAGSLSEDPEPSAAAVSFAGSVIVYFSIVGFLAGYLLTLLFLAGAFRRAGEKAYGGAFGQNETTARIREFWRPNGGAPDSIKESALKNWIQKNLEHGTTISDLLNRAELDNAREKVIADLRIP